MRIAVMSDVHANLPALQAVLEHASSAGFEQLWATGDLVGYGADPNEVLALLRQHDVVAVAGNHDLAACGLMGVEEFNRAAADAATWTAGELSEEHRAFLRELPLVRIAGDVTLAHGSIRQPEWEYLLSAEQALSQFELQTTLYSAVGHSHLPFVFEERRNAVPLLREARNGTRVELGDGRLIINPGSVGQPRDGDRRASYVLYDQEAATLTWHRVEYDIAAAQTAILAAGLAPWLAARLEAGR